MLDGAALHGKLVHSNNCLEQRSLLIYQNLMFNFRFLGIGTNNQLHLLPIKVLMAHQSKKNHCEWRLYKLFTHVIFWKSSFNSKTRDLQAIPFHLHPPVFLVMILVTERLRLGGQVYFPLEETMVSNLKSSTVLYIWRVAGPREPF